MDFSSLGSNREATCIIDHFFRQENCSQTCLLVVGPSGCGKTSLIHNGAKRNNVPLYTLSPRQLSDDEAGSVEQTILTAFNVGYLRKETYPHVIFIDNLDIWTPAQVSSPIHLRLTAALSDAVQSLTLDSRFSDQTRPVRFVATATSVKRVHPCLIRQACINQIVCLTALSYVERKSWCHDALKSVFPKPSHHGQLFELAQQFASVTPGFVHSDMHRFFSFLLMHCDDPAFQSDPSQLLQSSIVREALRSFTPSLLTHLNPLLSSMFQGAQPPLVYGLQEQLTLLNQCVNAVFSPYNEKFMKSSHSGTIHALKSIRSLGGVLIHGPTGCGKSTLVSHVTQSLDISVNILPLASASIVSSVIGEAERSISTIFSVARTIAPSIIIIDNIDVLAPQRGDISNDSNSSSESFGRLLSTLLVQIDGLQHTSTDTPPVLVVATTRSLDLLDPALLRPGRIDVHIPVLPPDPKSKQKILQDIWSANSFHPPASFNVFIFDQKSKGWSTAEIIAYARQMISTSTHSAKIDSSSEKEENN